MAFADEEDYGVDAVLWVGSVGQTGLYALGDVLSGAVNPVSYTHLLRATMSLANA